MHNVLKGEILIVYFSRNQLGDLYLNIDIDFNSADNVDCIVAIVSVT